MSEKTMTIMDNYAPFSNHSGHFEFFENLICSKIYSNRLGLDLVSTFMDCMFDTNNKKGQGITH